MESRERSSSGERWRWVEPIGYKKPQSLHVLPIAMNSLVADVLINKRNALER